MVDTPGYGSEPSLPQTRQLCQTCWFQFASGRKRCPTQKKNQRRTTTDGSNSCLDPLWDPNKDKKNAAKFLVLLERPAEPHFPFILHIRQGQYSVQSCCGVRTIYTATTHRSLCAIEISLCCAMSSCSQGVSRILSHVRVPGNPSCPQDSWSSMRVIATGT